MCRLQERHVPSTGHNDKQGAELHDAQTSKNLESEMLLMRYNPSCKDNGRLSKVI